MDWIKARYVRPFAYRSFSDDMRNLRQPQGIHHTQCGCASVGQYKLANECKWQPDLMLWPVVASCGQLWPRLLWQCFAWPLEEEYSKGWDPRVSLHLKVQQRLTRLKSLAWHSWFLSRSVLWYEMMPAQGWWRLNMAESLILGKL